MKKVTNLGKNRKTSWTGKEIFTQDLGKVEWLIENILPQGFFFLAGKPKMRKSFMSLQMALAIVSGGKFLGHQVLQPGRVLYISLEDNARRIKKRMLDMGLVTDLKKLELLEIEEVWPKLNKGGTEKLLERLSSKEYVLCIMDTYMKSFLLKDNNDAVEAAKCLTPLYEMTRAGGFSFCFVDHHRKNNQFSGDVIDDLSGSGAKAGVADTVWGLTGERGKLIATLKIASRDTEINEIDLVFDSERTLWVPKEFEIVKPGTIQARLLSYMGNNGRKAYINKMSKVLNLDISLISREIKNLEEKGMIYKGEKEGKNIPIFLKDRKLN